MGYNYRESGYGSCDYLIVTKKGKEEDRLPDGIVILTGQLYADPEFKAWLPTAAEKGTASPVLITGNGTRAGWHLPWNTKRRSMSGRQNAYAG